jgi:diadenosine tetraphosphatase ApaH/serine/threonine PP2A family protein phosphatase
VTVWPDRGSFSAECIFALFAFKLLDSSIVTLTRGNHESRTMNSIYGACVLASVTPSASPTLVAGFQGEILHRYGGSVYDLFCEAFCLLPLAAVLHGDPSEENVGRARSLLVSPLSPQNQVLVLHGGLFSSDDVTLDDIRAVNRDQQPPDSGLMCELLWSDPQLLPGRAPSKRGVGVSFGPDVTHAFLKRNHLKMLVRSHEVKDEGYEVECQGKLVTVFSAPKCTSGASASDSAIGLIRVQIATSSIIRAPLSTSTTASSRNTHRSSAWYGFCFFYPELVSFFLFFPPKSVCFFKFSLFFQKIFFFFFSKKKCKCFSR